MSNSVKQESTSLVSIVTPAYNSEKFIRSTIASVVNQTYTNWELIIVDDCSSDNTVKVVEELSKSDNRIKCFKNETNGGAGVSRNKGLEMATGRFIAFLDSDDLWYKDKLETQISYMIENKAPISFTSYDLVTSNNEKLNKVIKSIPFVDYKEVLKNTIIGMSTAIIDTSLVKKDFKFILLRTRQDLYLWITLLKRGHIAHGIDKVLTSYRVRANSISSNKIDGAKKVWYLYYKVEKMNFFTALYYFSFYAFNAIKKRLIS